MYVCLYVLPFWHKKNNNEKSAQRRRKLCALAVVRRSQKLSPHCRPLPGDAGRPKFNQLEMVTTFTNKPSLVRIDSRNFGYRGNTPTHKHTDRIDYNTLRRSLARSVITLP